MNKLESWFFFFQLISCIEIQMLSKDGLIIKYLIFLFQKFKLFLEVANIFWQRSENKPLIMYKGSPIIFVWCEKDGNVSIPTVALVNK